MKHAIYIDGSDAIKIADSEYAAAQKFAHALEDHCLFGTGPNLNVVTEDGRVLRAVISVTLAPETEGARITETLDDMRSIQRAYDQGAFASLLMKKNADLLQGFDFSKGLT